VVATSSEGYARRPPVVDRSSPTDVAWLADEDTDPKRDRELDEHQPSEDDDAGIEDPAFDDLEDQFASESTEQDANPSSVDVGPMLSDVEQDAEDGEPAELALDLRQLIQIPDSEPGEDDVNGPVEAGSEPLMGAPDDPASSDSDEYDTSLDVAIEDLPPPGPEIPESLEIEESSPDWLMDDGEITWSTIAWRERPLTRAYAPSRGLALAGNLLCVSGDSTLLLDTHATNPTPIDEVAVRSHRILALDADATQLLLVTVTGQLLLWRRDKGARDSTGPAGSLRVFGPDRVAGLWQKSPASDAVVIRLEDGTLLSCRSAGGDAEIQPISGDLRRVVALSDIGEPRVAIENLTTALRLRLAVGASVSSNPLPTTMEPALRSGRPLVAGFGSAVLVGVRDHGVWLSLDDGRRFTQIPGCRAVTAMCAGQAAGRPTAFLGLFSELEDRGEIVSVDLTSGRALGIAEVRVVTDSRGPEDDPPERARIDALLWDTSQQQLWAAGCFGLTRFVSTATPART